MCVGGFAACKVCRQYGGSARRDDLALGRGSFARFQNILRHGNATSAQQKKLATWFGPQPGINWDHEMAVQQWCREKSSALVPDSGAVVTESVARDRRSAFIQLRTLLETQGSFSSLEKWVAAAQVEKTDIQKHSHDGFKQCLQTMVSYERFITKTLLERGSAFRLQADGRKRVYQVEIGAVLWKFPAALEPVRADLAKSGCISCLGARGPWVAERLIGMHEFPSEMHLEGKASMVEDAVRSATLGTEGEVDTKLHQHILRGTRVWTSDGADLDVGHALAKGGFSSLVFHAWDESHSAGRLLASALKHDKEVVEVDRLLVTGKQPYSLAKFVSTSDVFRKKIGDAQVAGSVAFVQNFGWAPQRFQSRARPYARESRRWHAIWSAVAAEADGKDATRRGKAVHLLSSLSGPNSMRLLLGGMLADLSAEHYSWVATGDTANPDASTVMERADHFRSRLDVLFLQGHILKMGDTYTGATLAYLKQAHFYHYGSRCAAFGIGDMADPETRRQVREALQRVQRIVMNIEECFKVYRAETSWLALFTAFRLPSTRSCSKEGARVASSCGCISCAKEKLQQILAKASVQQPQTALAQWERLLPRAEALQQSGRSNREAWGQAAGEFPEFGAGRELVELFLVWKTSTGNLERRFRSLAEVDTPQRSSMLDGTVETIMFASQAPPSAHLIALSRGDEQQTSYLSQLQVWHERRYPVSRETTVKRKQRRDAGVSRVPVPASVGPVAASAAPVTEAAFGRKREAAIADAVASSPSKRACVAPDMNWVQQADDPEPAPTCVEDVAKRVQQQAGKTTASVVAKREAKVVRSSIQVSLKSGAKQRPAGILLVLPTEQAAIRTARRLGFKLTHDPVEFVSLVGGKRPRTPRKAHAVLAPIDGKSDYAVCAHLAAAIMGAWFTNARTFVSDGRTGGCQYEERCRARCRMFKLAVSADLQAQSPSLIACLRTVAQVPGSTFELHAAERLIKLFSKEQKKNKREYKRTDAVAANWALLSLPSERSTAPSGVQLVYRSVPAFISLVGRVNREAWCPGYEEIPD